jgi:hypothetical protein
MAKKKKQTKDDDDLRQWLADLKSMADGAGDHHVRLKVAMAMIESIERAAKQNDLLKACQRSYLLGMAEMNSLAAAALRELHDRSMSAKSDKQMQRVKEGYNELNPEDRPDAARLLAESLGLSPKQVGRYLRRLDIL